METKKISSVTRMVIKYAAALLLVLPALVLMISPMEGVSFWAEVLIRIAGVAILVIGGELVLWADPDMKNEEV